MRNRNFPLGLTEQTLTVIWLRIIDRRQTWSYRQDTSFSVPVFIAIHLRRGTRLGETLFKAYDRKSPSLFITESLQESHHDRSAFLYFRDPSVQAANGPVLSCPCFLSPPVNLQARDYSIAGGVGIGVIHTRVQILPRLFASCVILNKFLSLLEIQLTQMQLIVANL